MNRREAILSPIAVAVSAVTAKAEEVGAKVRTIDKKPLLLIISCKHEQAMSDMHNVIGMLTKRGYPEMANLPIMIVKEGEFEFQVVSEKDEL